MRSRLVLCAAMAAACVASPWDRARLGDELRARTGASLRTDGRDTTFSLPPDVSLDALTPAQAVAVALWNNPAFQSELSQLGFARADLADAGMLPNPTLSLLLPIGPRPVEAWLAWPFEVLWQRPHRVAAAQLDVERAARALTQTGLDLARDVRLAHADATLALARRALRDEQLRLARALCDAAELRVRAGDLGAREAAPARVDLGLAVDALARADLDVLATHTRLATLLGLPHASAPFTLTAGPEVAAPDALEGLVRRALAQRPDVRAAELAVSAAAERQGWERARIVGLVARLDGFGPTPGVDGSTFTARVGAQLTVPLFNQNQAGRERAEAELERAAWRLVQTRQQVEADVTLARVQLVTARDALDPWRRDVVPAADEAVAGARAAFERGDAALVAVLDADRRRVDVRLRDAELVADLHRAAASLDRALGGSP